MNANEEFGKRISELRKQAGLSQKQLGEILEVSNKAVSKWEMGESFPQTKTIIKIAQVFKMSPDELLTGEKTADNDTEVQKSIEKISSLESENERLKTALAKTGKKRNKTLVLSSVFCAVCFLAVLVLAIIPNKELYPVVPGAGQSGTSVEFSGKTFYPAGDFEKFLFENHTELSDKKYADFVSADSTKKQITIFCESYLNFIIVPSAKERYVYVSGTEKFVLSPENVLCIDLEEKDAIYNGYKSIYSPQGIALFCKYYNEKKIPENSQQITKLYYSNKNMTVSVSFGGLDIDYADMGCLFQDASGNLYFYDNSCAKTYVMGRELLNDVE